jgi:hypothetical protein
MNHKVIMTYSYEVTLTQEEYNEAHEHWSQQLDYELDEWGVRPSIKLEREYVYDFVVETSTFTGDYQENVKPLGFEVRKV